jgi:RNA polymerase sigma-70 factor, ECF subfamily
MTSMALKRAFVRRDPDAVRRIYNECRALVYRVAYKILGNPSLAEEATQEVFERSWQAAHTFDISREFEPWIAVIAWRAAVDISRREFRRRHETLNEAESQSILVEDTLEIESILEVRRALKALPPDERNVVYLQFYEGLTHGQIADRLKIPLGTVKSRADRARHQLSASLIDCGPARV